MQSVTEIMQIDEADSIVWCKGVRLICTRLVETNLTLCAKPGVSPRAVYLCLSMRAAWCVTKRRGGCSMSMFEIVLSPTGGTEKVSGLVTGTLMGMSLLSI